MSLSSLQALADKRPDLLLAEAVGWLHDYRKCSEEHLQAQTPGSKTQALSRTDLATRQPTLQNVNFALLNTSRTVADLLNDRTWNQDILGQLLSRCHNTAHFDKQEPIDGEQNYPGTQISSPFGFEQPVATNLTNGLWNLPWQDLGQVATHRQTLQERVSALFSLAVADSRRPINEVDLWSWGTFVGALYKAALSGALLTGSIPAAKDLRWRLLSVRVDGLEYLSHVARIPDLLARQRLLKAALDEAQTLLEVIYPLGSQVYRDQNGSVFIVPDVPNLLEIADGQGNTLQAKIVHTFANKMDGELLPAVSLEQSSWWGQDPTWSKNSSTANNDRLPNIKDMLTVPVVPQTDVRAIERFWQGKGGNYELCPVCRLRPMKEGAEACETCLKRRGSRIQTWQQDPHHTIWMDELADANGRVALLVGKFGLDDWLSGDLVQTMLVKAVANAPDQCVPKNPSPARLRRVWETCARFWSETVEQKILAQYEYGRGTDNAQQRCMRLLVIPGKQNGWKENAPYDGTVNGKPISLLWREDAKYLVTIINLQLTGELKQGQTITVSDPDEPRKQIAFKVQGVMQAMDGMGEYTPFLSLLSSPDQFLALVPAADALDVAEKIRVEYVRQFGKVQNRLPLFLGIVFFPRKMPLMAVMDAARRMLGVQLDGEQWTVDNKTVDSEERLVNSKTVTQQVCALKLKKDGREMTLRVQMTMGDGSGDKWYPYFQVERFADATLDHRTYRFQHNGHWLVHVNDLKPSDVIQATPSRFAYLWLEHTAKRFEFDPQRDVLLLDELPRLMEMWKNLKQSGITLTGLRNVQSLLDAKASTWDAQGAEFTHLVETTLKEAGLSNVITPQDVIGGRFSHCLELYLYILKKKIKED